MARVYASFRLFCDKCFELSNIITSQCYQFTAISMGMMISRNIYVATRMSRYGEPPLEIYGAGIAEWPAFGAILAAQPTAASG